MMNKVFHAVVYVPICFAFMCSHTDVPANDDSKKYTPIPYKI